MRRYCNLAGWAILAVAGVISLPGTASANDPLASNNGLLPGMAEYTGPFKTANFNYPEVADPSVALWTPGLT